MLTETWTTTDFAGAEFVLPKYAIYRAERDIPDNLKKKEKESAYMVDQQSLSKEIFLTQIFLLLRIICDNQLFLSLLTLDHAQLR